MDLKYNTFKLKEGETVSRTFTRCKALMNELVNDVVKLSKLEINIDFINNLPKKWLSFSRSLKDANHVRDSDLASMFGKIKYEERLIDSLYESEKKTLSTATTLAELRPNKDFKAKYNKIKAKLALLTSVKVLMTLADDEKVAVGKKSARNGE
ncbi:hypothetical protein Tco_0117350 [Tanacetum coccineum]